MDRAIDLPNPDFGLRELIRRYKPKVSEEEREGHKILTLTRFSCNLDIGEGYTTRVDVVKTLEDNIRGAKGTNRTRAGGIDTYVGVIEIDVDRMRGYCVADDGTHLIIGVRVPNISDVREKIMSIDGLLTSCYSKNISIIYEYETRISNLKPSIVATPDMVVYGEDLQRFINAHINRESLVTFEGRDGDGVVQIGFPAILKREDYNHIHRLMETHVGWLRLPDEKPVLQFSRKNMPNERPYSP